MVPAPELNCDGRSLIARSTRKNGGDLICKELRRDLSKKQIDTLSPPATTLPRAGTAGGAPRW